ncbi:hypothetical protein LTR95_006138 [Oleoguttula sp. CCFEE 5521]
MANEEGDLWLFGYGQATPIVSLKNVTDVPQVVDMEAATTLRRQDEVADEVADAQASEDHRGTPEQPGRVVTLIDRQLWETLTDQHPSAPPQVQGAAYRIPSKHVAEVKAYLDIREINGYSMHYTPFHPLSSASKTSNSTTTPGSATKNDSGPVTPIQCLVYIGTPDNPQFLGPQDPQALAERIVMCRGPSGENREYLFMLEEALAGLKDGVEGDGVVDEHVTDLAARTVLREFLADDHVA